MFKPRPRPVKSSNRPTSSLARTGPVVPPATVQTTPLASKTPGTKKRTTNTTQMNPTYNNGVSGAASSSGTTAAHQAAVRAAQLARNALAPPPPDAAYPRQQPQNMVAYPPYIPAVLLPSMRLLNDNQEILIRQTRESQDALRGEMAKVREDMKAISERSMKHEEEDKQARERHVEEVKALTIIADRMGTIQQNVEHVSGMIGKSKIPYGPQTRGMLDIMEGLEMDLQEWLEKARDPTSNDSASSLTPVETTPAPPPAAVLPVITPPVVRHEMATSPVKPLYANAAVSQTPPPPSPSIVSRPILPALVLSPVETQMQQDLTDLSPLSSVSDKPSTTADPDVSPDKTLISEPSEVTNDIAETATIGAAKDAAMEVDDHTTDPFLPAKTVDAQQPVKYMEIDTIDVQSTCRSADPTLDPPSSAYAPVTTTMCATPPRQVAPCNVQEREGSALPSTRLKTQRLAAFSPVDWTKALATSSARVPTRSSSFQSPTKAPFVPPATSSSPTRTYSLPAPPEGSIAALRQQTLGAPYLLDSTVDATKVDSPVRTTVIAGDAAEAAERMLSPETT
ncbi:hypothetical protein CPB83DRAFT_345076 [Crepidotus variabilis]|uniref:Uncharacterized protein n=1 Tax=Crepidotus variabilis TaxID=179855 RepID=A0A9P6JQ08_9AGAR|nr:hypothetical protein CPB83DRAFT_345076 [Crepidotus variabilis]